MALPKVVRQPEKPFKKDPALTERIKSRAQVLKNTFSTRQKVNNRQKGGI